MNSLCQSLSHENCHACDNRHHSYSGSIHSKTCSFIYKSKGIIVDKQGNKSNFEFITVPLKDNKIFIEIIRNI